MTIIPNNNPKLVLVDPSPSLFTLYEDAALAYAAATSFRDGSGLGDDFQVLPIIGWVIDGKSVLPVSPEGVGYGQAHLLDEAHGLVWHPECGQQRAVDWFNEQSDKLIEIAEAIKARAAGDGELIDFEEQEPTPSTFTAGSSGAE